MANLLISLPNDGRFQHPFLERLQGTSPLFETHSLSELIHSAVNDCEPTARAKEITLQKDCPDDIMVKVDPILMEQAIFNLLDNAVKYSKEKQAVLISAHKENGAAHIMVEDTGCGIDKEHLQKFLIAFTGWISPEVGNRGGTGLGLAIVKHIVQYHQGKIEVHSKKGRGNTFRIRIPDIRNEDWWS
jgi:two-component system, OmpR family, phosphate regulon sensor histidine kinase PhoR